ncbi:MAG: glycosyltransferase [Bacteroidetes bacterium]|nr:glycosyltransferase [Bacteroidota bacterium]
MAPIIQNVSFIIIARNEQDVLHRCLDSILRLSMVNCEVICVDSSSTDGTLSIMKAYQKRHPFFVVLSPTDCRNAATARNHGMRVASKSKIFFIDGDTVLYTKFVHAALYELDNPNIFAVTGGLDEIIYSDTDKKPLSGPYVRHNYSHKMKVMICGGIFIAKTEAIKTTGLYDERFYINEDGDYTLRLTKNFQMIALPSKMGIHHTDKHEERPWLFFRKRYILNQGMLARKHWRRHGFWGAWYRSRKIFVYGFVSVNVLMILVALHLYGVISWTPLALFTMVLITLQIVYSKLKKLSLISTLIKSLLSPYFVFLGFCLEPIIKRLMRRE